jgi:hypothetical protein
MSISSHCDVITELLGITKNYDAVNIYAKKDMRTLQFYLNISIIILYRDTTKIP